MEKSWLYQSIMGDDPAPAPEVPPVPIIDDPLSPYRKNAFAGAADPILKRAEKTRLIENIFGEVGGMPAPAPGTVRSFSVPEAECECECLHCSIGLHSHCSAQNKCDIHESESDGRDGKVPTIPGVLPTTPTISGKIAKRAKHRAACEQILAKAFSRLPAPSDSGPQERLLSSMVSYVEDAVSDAA
jgi:hypothetical protein